MAKVKATRNMDIELHQRGWGYELWIENMDEYCGKLLHIYKGKKSSLHFHMNKMETMFVKSGKVDLLLIDPDDGKEYTVTLYEGDSIRLDRGQVHQIQANYDNDVELIEFSTKHEDSDSKRVRKGD